MDTGSWIYPWVNWGSARLPSHLSSLKTQVLDFCLACLPAVPCWPPILAFVFLIPERRASVYHRLKFILCLCFPIIDSNSSYRRPAEGKHVLLTQPSTSSRRHSGGGLPPWGKRGVTFPLVMLFFSISLSGDNKTCFPLFPKEILNFLIDYSLPKIHLPSAISCWIGRVVWVNFKIKDCPSFSWKGNHHNQNFHSCEAVWHHWNSPWLSHPVCTHVKSGFIIPSSPFSECRVGLPHTWPLFWKGGGLPRVRWDRYWVGGVK